MVATKNSRGKLGKFSIFLLDIFTFFEYVKMKGHKSRCCCAINSKYAVKKVVYDKMIVHKATKDSTAP